MPRQAQRQDPLSAGNASLPVNPTHIASWCIETSAGPSRRVALAAPDNSIWIHTSPLFPSTNRTPPAPSQPLPSIITSSPALEPPAPPSAFHKQRSRATSSTSSILTKSSRRRGAAFSPPTSAVQLPTTSLASATALPVGQDDHGRSSVSERNELLEHLREQAKEEEDESSLSRLSGIARRGLPGVQGKEDHDSVEGTTSPRSTVSVDSSRTFTDIFSWKRGDEEERRKKELKDKIQEIDVEREIERENREEERERQEEKVLRAAQRSQSKPRHKRTKTLDVYGEGLCPSHVSRVVLSEPDQGTISCMKVFDGLGLAVLRNNGRLDVYSITDLKRSRSISLEDSAGVASSSKSLHLSSFWFWRSLHRVSIGEAAYLAADGIPWPCDMPSPNGELTHVVVIPCNPEKQDAMVHLDLPGVGHIGITTSGTPPQPYLLHFLSDTLTSYPLTMTSQVATHAAPPERYNSPIPRAVTAAFHSQNLSLLRPSTPGPGPAREPALKRNKSFTMLRSEGSDRPGVVSEDRGFSGLLGRRRAPRSIVVPRSNDDTVELGEGKEVERDGYGQWNGIRVSSTGEGVGWTDDAVDMFTCDGVRLNVKHSVTMTNELKVQDATCSPGWRDLVIRTQESVLLHRDQKLVQHLPPAFCFDMDDKRISLLLVTSDELVCLNLSIPNDPPLSIIELRVSNSDRSMVNSIPLENDRIVTIDDRGNASCCTLNELVSGRIPEHAGLGSDRQDARVTVARTVSTSEDFFVAGDEDGIIRIWTTSPFELQGSWTCFADSPNAIGLLDQNGSGAPRLFCVSESGTIALIDLYIMDLLYLIPASRAPLRMAFVCGNDLLLAYANGKARVWNLKTCEFRRSTGLDAADDMLQSGEWIEIDLHAPAPSQALSSANALMPPSSDLGRMLKLDIRAFEQSINRFPSASPLSLARNLLSLIMTWDVDKKIDETCVRGLGIQRTKSIVGVSIDMSDANFTSASGREVWQISPEATATRQLYLVTLLRTFLNSPDHEQAAAEAIAYYTVTILDIAVPPDLEFFVEYYMDPIANIQQSARMLFASRLSNMTEGQIEAVVETHKQNLPQNISTEKRQTAAALQALTLVGAIAVHQYESLSPAVLKDIAESIHLYIADVSCPHLGIAIELASKGFTIWQTYLDPMEMLRLLFYLSTHTPPSAAISAQARLAVLHVASTNPALFMSTLSMDILDAKTTEGRTSIMKLCVYMARKNPSVLENGLPRIAEAVVKSLDPNIGKMREDVREAATVILNELVLAFTTIDFHSTSQRLAVGTHEGAVIMYDLKSASRLYVLEAHRGPVSSVNFSPDGRRLLTVSLEDGDVTVWKVGSSLSGFFNVGGPPRQGAVGAGKGGPFKRIPFKRADDEPMEEISALSDIKVEWLGERQARVMIKETALTFET